MMMMLKTNSVIPDDCRIFSQRAAFPSSPYACNLHNCDDEPTMFVIWHLTEITVWMSVKLSLSVCWDLFFTSRHCSSPKDKDSYVTLGSPGSQSSLASWLLAVITWDSRYWARGQRWLGTPPQKTPLLLLPDSHLTSSQRQSPPPPPPSQNMTPLRSAW